MRVEHLKNEVSLPNREPSLLKHKPSLRAEQSNLFNLRRIVSYVQLLIKSVRTAKQIASLRY